MSKLVKLLILIIASNAFVCAQALPSPLKRFSDRDFSFEIRKDSVVKKSDDIRTYESSVNFIYIRVYSEKDLPNSRYAFARQMFGRDLKTISFSDGGEGLYGEFDHVDGFHHYLFLAKVNERFYIFQAIAKTVDAVEPRTFFRSIRVRGRNIPFQFMPTTEAAVTPPVTVGPNLGSPSSGAIRTPIRVLAAPRPNYTDAARMFDIQGTVILSATFNADGTVGDIQVIRGVPLGLTKAAIAAAKLLRFTPATIDGKNVSMRKNIEYAFIID